MKNETTLLAKRTAEPSELNEVQPAEGRMDQPKALTARLR